MTGTSSFVAELFHQKLNNLGGLPAALQELAAPSQYHTGVLPQPTVLQSAAALDTTERQGVHRFPTVLVYCEKIKNEQREKGRSFSGEISLCAEVRVSAERFDQATSELNWLVDGVAQVLAQSRGEWAPGVLCTGRYEVSFGPVKAGGRNVIQSAKISFPLLVSIR